MNFNFKQSSDSISYDRVTKLFQKHQHKNMHLSKNEQLVETRLHLWQKSLTNKLWKPMNDAEQFWCKFNKVFQQIYVFLKKTN